MALSNTEDEYGLIARAFHWSIAVLILGLIPVGLFMTGMENSPVKFQVYALHKSFGLLVFFLGLGRLLWRFLSPPPDDLESHKGWERALAGAAHFWLYVCVIGMPLSGWMMSSAGEFPVPFFGIQMPAILDKDENLLHLFGQVHEILAWTLLVVLGLHMAGALKHHVLDRDETLSRMAFGLKGMGFPVLVVVVAGAVYGVSAMLIAKGFMNPGAETAQENTVAQVPAAALPDTANLQPGEWAIVKERSSVTFTATMYGAPFTGTFKDFSGSILFNPDDLAAAKASIVFNMKDVVTGDADRDSNIGGEAWFDSASFPEARFETMTFEKAEGNNYVAVGNLTIREKTMPVALPFTLDITENTASAKGTVTLNRLNFGIGTGEWEDGKTVGTDVKVDIDITAIR
jgi:cytochrome b561/polyisoprenoid-binding protein YceI